MKHIILTTILMTACGEQQLDNNAMALAATGETKKETEQVMVKGETGAAGQKGDKGEKGETGDKGETGATGPKGDRGDKGENGNDGLRGIAGARGEAGAKGDTGATGAVGQTGAKGDAGARGETGSAGLAGAKGDQGERGEIGATGATGASGANGAVGATGETGAAGQKGDKGDTGDAGVSAFFLTMTDSSDAALGNLYGVNATTNEFYVVKNKLRMQFTRANGTFPNAYLVFSGLNCTGEARLVITNGQFANTFVDGRDGSTIWKATGKNAGTFNYLSRVAASNSCANATNNVAASWEVEHITLDFTYPIVGADIEND